MNTLIRYIVIMLFVSGIGYEAFSQGGRPPAFRQNGRASAPNSGERLESIRTEYLKQQLKLSPAESDKFWPLYTQYQQELKEIGFLRKANNVSTQPDASKEMAFEQRILNIRQRYHEEFLKVLPLEKVNLLYKSESDFKYELLRHLREGKGATPDN